MRRNRIPFEYIIWCFRTWKIRIFRLISFILCWTIKISIFNIFLLYSDLNRFSWLWTFSLSIFIFTLIRFVALIKRYSACLWNLRFIFLIINYWCCILYRNIKCLRVFLFEITLTMNFLYDFFIFVLNLFDFFLQIFKLFMQWYNLLSSIIIFTVLRSVWNSILILSSRWINFWLRNGCCNIILRSLKWTHYLIFKVYK